MKKLIFLFLIAMITISSFAQNDLTGALGLTFGNNMTTVKNTMIKKGATVSKTGEDFINFSNVKMGIRTYQHAVKITR